MTASTWIILGITGIAGAWWLFGREDYFVRLPGGSYEYFGDLAEARAFARKHSGAKLYQIPKGGEFDEKRALRLTPNRRKRKRRVVSS